MTMEARGVLAADLWIDKRDRLPTVADADSYNCVLAWHAYQGVMVAGWRQLAINRHLTHWMPTIEGPTTDDA